MNYRRLKIHVQSSYSTWTRALQMGCLLFSVNHVAFKTIVLSFVSRGMWACVCVCVCVCIHFSNYTYHLLPLTSPCILFICNSFPIKAYTGRFF